MAVLPDASVTVHVTVVDPIGNVEGASFTTEATEQLSDAVALPKETLDAEHKFKSALTKTSDGQVITGGS